MTHRTSAATAAQTILRLLNSVASISSLRQLLAQILHFRHHKNTSISSSFITSCNSLNLLPYALLFFSHLPGNPHVFVCNTLLRVLAHSNSSSSSSLCFPIYAHKMLRTCIRPNNYTFPLLLKSLADLRLSPQGLSLHAHILQLGHSSDIYVQNSLLNLYSTCGDMGSCQNLFDEMPVRDPVSWTTLIEGYRKAGLLEESLVSFERMQFSGVAPNRVTVVNAAAACASMGALEMGIWIHGYVHRQRWDLDVIMGTSLVDMYGKCGRVEDSMTIFSSMREKNVYTWNSLIHGLALAKSGREALHWFSKMEEEGFKPDSVTLIVALCACSHGGLLEEGRELFGKVVDGFYGFSAGVKHYGCMVDLLGRAGLVQEASVLVEKMPFEGNAVVYGSLVGACRARGDAQLSEMAAEKLVELDPGNMAYRVLLSNSYAALGRWRQVEETRRLMRERQDGKLTHCWVAKSLVDVGNDGGPESSLDGIQNIDVEII